MRFTSRLSAYSMKSNMRNEGRDRNNISLINARLRFNMNVTQVTSSSHNVCLLNVARSALRRKIYSNIFDLRSSNFYYREGTSDRGSSDHCSTGRLCLRVYLWGGQIELDYRAQLRDWYGCLRDPGF